MFRQDYESDLNFSLMPAIEALLKPDEDDTPRSKKAPASSYRRRANQDFCYGCSTAGELICCDRCPASFHLECHDPPLTEKDVPQGPWLCRSCKSDHDAELPRQKKVPLMKSGSLDSRMELLPSRERRRSRPSTPVDPQENLLLALGVARKIFPKRSNSEAPMQRLSLSVEPKAPSDALISPWDQLVKAASRCNPRKFELPREMCVHQLFPGDDKGEVRNGKNKNGRNGNGTNGSSCMTSIRNKTQEVANGAVPMPSKTCFSCRRSSKKAPLISCDFCPLFFHQDCLDPPMTALPTTMWMCPVHPHQVTDWKNISSMAATERVKLWSKFNPTVDQDTVKTQFLRRVHSDRLKPRWKLKPRMRDRAEIPPMVQYHYENPPPMLVSMKSLHRIREMENREKLHAAEDGPGDEDLAIIDLINGDIEQLKGAHELANNGGETIAAMEEDEGIPPPPPVATTSLLQHFQEKVNNTHKDLSEIFKVFHAEGKLEDLLSEIKRSTEGEGVGQETDPRKDEENIRPQPPLKRLFHLHSDRTSTQSERIQSRAILTPIVGNPLETTPPRPLLELSVQMRYRKLTIGTLHSNDLQLDGRCPQQSEKHATIFYDEFTRTFELLNYSAHGTEVNGQLYSLHFGPRKEVAKRRAAPDVRERIAEIIDKKRGIQRIKYGTLDKGTEMAAPETVRHAFCNCAWRPPLAAGWEGSAVLNHGYLLNFGCESFVFSIPDPFDVEEDSN